LAAHCAVKKIPVSICICVVTAVNSEVRFHIIPATISKPLIHSLEAEIG